MATKKKVLWTGKTEVFSKERVQTILENGYLPADPNAIKKNEGDYWVIYGNAKVDYVPTKVVKK